MKKNLTEFDRFDGVQTFRQIYEVNHINDSWSTSHGYAETLTMIIDW